MCNEKSVEIALSKLSAYCHVTGVIYLEDANDLKDIEFRAVVSADTNKTDEYSESTKIDRVLHLDGSRAGTKTVSTSGAKPAPAKPKPKSTPKAPVQVEIEEEEEVEETEAPVKSWGKTNPVNETFQEGATSAKPSWKK